MSTPLRFNFRPRSYFLTNLDTAVLSRIKGRARRAAVRRLGFSHADQAMAAESLSEDERQAVGRVHPSFMGGEYLPDLNGQEVEIARIELESTTADVISLRASQADGKICYRLMDEYDTPYRITPASSEQPLTFGQLVGLIHTIQLEGELWFQALQEANREDFIHVSSEFYPQLTAHFEAEAEHRAEPDAEPAQAVAGGPSPEDVTTQALLECGTRSYDKGDFVTARECFVKGAERGDAPAEARLAFLYFHGHGVPRSYEKARILWERAASKGLAKAHHNLGVLHDNGLGVPQNYAKAREWYEKAAGLGFGPAQFSLGYLFVSGQGVPQDYGKARQWWEQAARQGDIDAQVNLGKMFLCGLGVPQSYERARSWWELAAAQGDTDAQAHIDWLNDNVGVGHEC